MPRHQIRLLCSTVLCASGVFALACGEDEPPPPPPPPPTILAVDVVDTVSAMPIAGARMIVDGQGDWQTVNDAGHWEMEIDPGRHTFRVEAANHFALPRPFRAAPEVMVVAEQTTTIQIELGPTPEQPNGASVSGLVTRGGMPVAGVLVVAQSTVNYFTYTDDSGAYTLPGIRPNLYSISGFFGGTESTAVGAVQVVAGTDQDGIDLELTDVAGATASGSIADSGGSTTVHLTHRLVGEPIPGLAVDADFAATWTISGIPVGSFPVRAALENDGKVLSAQAELDDGVPTVDTTATSSATVDLLITDAVLGISPTATSSGASTTPELSWSSHPDGDFYVIEVRDESGRTVWGGFDALGNPRVRVLPPETSAIYAGDPLSPGSTYTWRVFAAKRDMLNPAAFLLEAASEELLGVFTVLR